MKAELRDYFEQYLSRQVALLFNDEDPAIQRLNESIAYGVLGGGKRFRPLMVLAAADDLGIGPQPVLPWAMAVEMVHAYSLIHDDLPCMDNDSLRRGKPTVHIQFGEATALLAGDALLTGAFAVIATGTPSAQCAPLVKILAQASGHLGMIGGQAIDLDILPSNTHPQRLERCHRLKTGALIEASLAGVAQLAGLPFEKSQKLVAFARDIGLAFQIKDDLLDHQTEKSAASYAKSFGEGGAAELLLKTHESALEHLSTIGIRTGLLAEFVAWNHSRAE